MSAQAYEDEGQKIAASLLLESRMPAAGTETTLAIRMSPPGGLAWLLVKPWGRRVPAAAAMASA
ncbi:hypothetical protein [Shewanella algae]|uniref:hypothetical protein n=1 Tax=Shewanella algae TaxID=38313 RepID=UPI003007419E